MKLKYLYMAEYIRQLLVVVVLCSPSSFAYAELRGMIEVFPYRDEVKLDYFIIYAVTESADEISVVPGGLGNFLFDSTPKIIKSIYWKSNKQTEFALYPLERNILGNMRDSVKFGVKKISDMQELLRSDVIEHLRKRRVDNADHTLKGVLTLYASFPDDIRRDNQIDNLEYALQSEVIDEFQKMIYRLGANKLTDAEIDIGREWHRAFISYYVQPPLDGDRGYSRIRRGISAVSRWSAFSRIVYSNHSNHWPDASLESGSGTESTGSTFLRAHSDASRYLELLVEDIALVQQFLANEQVTGFIEHAKRSVPMGGIEYQFRIELDDIKSYVDKNSEQISLGKLANLSNGLLKIGGLVRAHCLKAPANEVLCL